MSNSFSWEGSSMIISDYAENQKLINCLKQEGISLSKEEGKFVLANQFDHFIFEDEFIAQSNNLNIMIKKYLNKNYNTTVKIYSPQEESFVN